MNLGQLLTGIVEAMKAQPILINPVEALTRLMDEGIVREIDFPKGIGLNNLRIFLKTKVFIGNVHDFLKDYGKFILKEGEAIG